MTRILTISILLALAASVASADVLAVKSRSGKITLEGIKDEIASSDQRLYSGSIRNPKELGDLQAKVASLRRLLEKREEQLLEAMIALEDAEAAQSAAQENLVHVEAKWGEDQVALKAEREELAGRLGAIAAERGALLPHIQRDLSLYQSLRKTKGGLAVTMMRGGACTACGMEIPPGRLEHGRKTGLLSCGNCERILATETEVR